MDPQTLFAFATILSGITLDVQIDGVRVVGQMTVEVTPTADAPPDANGTVRFPLPPGAALFGADLEVDGAWLPAELIGWGLANETWNDVLQPEPPPQELPPPEIDRCCDDPLLIHRIDADLYRAFMYPVLRERPFRFRVRYAHALPTDSADAELPILMPGWFTGNDGFPRRVRWSVDHSGRKDGGEVEDFGEGRGITFRMPPIDTGDGAAESADSGQADLVVWQAEDEGDAWLHGVVDAGLPADLGRPSRTTVFLLDVSGSMGLEKLREATRAVAACLSTLGPDDRFALLAFSSTVEAFDVVTLPATPETLQRARAWLEAQRAHGGTNLSDAIKQAVHMLEQEVGGGLEVVVATDGRPDRSTIDGQLAQQWLSDRIRQWPSPPTVHAVGIGHDVDASYLRELVAETGGRTALAWNDAELVGVVRRLYEEVRPGSLRAAQLTIWGDELADPAHSHLAKLRPGGTFEIGARLATADGAPADAVHLQLHGKLPDGQPWRRVWSVNPPAPGQGIAARAAPALYGRLLTEALVRDMGVGGESEELLMQSAVGLRRFGVVGWHSAYLALDSEQMYADRNIRRVERDAAGVAVGDLSDTALPAARQGGAGAIDGAHVDPWLAPSAGDMGPGGGGGLEAESLGEYPVDAGSSSNSGCHASIAGRHQLVGGGDGSQDGRPAPMALLLPLLLLGFGPLRRRRSLRAPAALAAQVPPARSSSRVSASNRRRWCRPDGRRRTHAVLQGRRAGASGVEGRRKLGRNFGLAVLLLSIAACDLYPGPGMPGGVGPRPSAWAEVQSIDTDRQVDGLRAETTLTLTLVPMDPDEPSEEHDVILRLQLPPSAVLTGADVRVTQEGKRVWLEGDIAGRRAASRAHLHGTARSPLMAERLAEGLHQVRAWPATALDPIRVRLRWNELLDDPGEAWLVRGASEPPLPVEASPGDNSATLAADEPIQLSSWSAGDGISYVHALWRPGLTEASAGPPRQVLFLVEASSAMRDDGFAAATRAVRQAGAALRPLDRVAVIAFSDRPRVMPGGWQTWSDRLGADAERWLDAVDPWGPANVGAGLEAALQLSADAPFAERVELVLLVGGPATLGERDPDALAAEYGPRLAAADPPLRLLGAGTGAKEFRPLLGGLADATGGQFRVAPDSHRLAGVVIDLLSETGPAGLGGVWAALEGDVVTRSVHCPLVATDRGLRVEVGATITGPGPATLVLAGVDGEGRPVSRSVAVQIPAASDQATTVPARYGRCALSMLERWLDEGAAAALEEDAGAGGLPAEDPELVSDAILTGRRFGIVGRYTALVASHRADQVDRDDGGVALDRVQLEYTDESRRSAQLDATWSDDPPVFTDPGALGGAGADSGHGLDDGHARDTCAASIAKARRQGQRLPSGALPMGVVLILGWLVAPGRRRRPAGQAEQAEPAVMGGSAGGGA